MTRTEFFRAIAPALGRAYADGHTELLTPDEEWSGYKAHGGMAPPFTVRIEDGRILVDRSLGEPALAPGAELVSLNGVPEASLRDWLVNSESMETDAGRAAEGAHRFAVRVWSLGLRAPYAIITRAPGAAPTAGGDLLRHPGRDLDPAAIAERRCGRVGEHRQRRRPSGGEGISNSPGTSTRCRLKAAFQKIHDAKVHAVVLDLRQNTGGDTRQSDALCRPISPTACCRRSRRWT